MQKCIFYLPYKLDAHASGARMLRPRKMIQAFRDIGYDVFVIQGVSSERRALIREIRQKIRGGEKYDFMYTESHTEPTLLTDPSHLPTHPFLDFGFFRFVKRHGIPIGLFYCDIYWKFDTYGAELPGWKKRSALMCYNHDIKQYKKLLSRFYLPDLKMCEYLREPALTRIARELPPGAEDIQVQRNENDLKFDTARPLRLFYVGGLGNQYQIAELIKAVSQTEKSELVICCREKEWEKEKDNLQPDLCSRVKIIHKNSDELQPYYDAADVCSLLFQPGQYIAFAKPFKAYEYLANEIPVMATKGTAIGRFVEENDIGWCIPFTAEAIQATMERLIAHPEEIAEKRRNCGTVKGENLWKTRAQTVADELK